MFLCTEACPLLYDQIANARWEDQLPRLRDLGDFQEKIKKGNDHLHDCAQYLAALHVRPARRHLAAARPAAAANDVEREWAAGARRRAARRGRARRGAAQRGA